MSRIQQVLQKAEPDGTARRTRAVREAAVGSAQRTPILVGPEAGARVDVVDRAPARLAEPMTETAARIEAEARPHPLLIAATAPHSAPAERYRSLRTRIAQIEGATLRRVLMLTSPGRGEGKSMTAMNLAITMAQEFHRRVLVVDGDLRRPSLHALLGLAPSPGLSDVLLGGARLDEAMITVPDYRLTVLPAGMPTEQPTELLGSSAMRRVLDQLRSHFDRVVLDTPPACGVADAGVLAHLADAVLLIVRAGVTPKPAIERSLAEIEAGKILGLVLNDAGGPETAAYGTLIDEESHPRRPTAAGRQAAKTRRR